MINFNSESCIPLSLESVIIPDNLLWRPYNHKHNNKKRFGASITSVDGTSDSFDLDSILEYNKKNNTNYDELSFQKRTKDSNSFDKLFSLGLNIGRSHFLQLEAGGFFPYHRDPCSKTIRLLYTIEGCDSEYDNSLVWIQKDKVLPLRNHKWYLINTQEKHCVFSFSKSVFAIFNIENNCELREILYDKFSTR